MDKSMNFEVIDSGLIDFTKSLEQQRNIFQQIKLRVFESALITCRHNAVITLGRQAHLDNILISDAGLKLKGIQTCLIERGGDVTYHGPGQLIVYPIFNLGLYKKDVNFFLRQLEEILISLLFCFGIKAVRIKGLTGVWVKDKKIASIGIAIKNWITFHGLSLNIKKDDLDNYNLIRPCGMDIKMTSLETVLGRNIEIDVVKVNLISKFRDVFAANREGVPIT
ncbi:MAG: lipoyl(octanoyl) transferase LipB, partial [Candidatus Omnitrophota bacterium]